MEVEEEKMITITMIIMIIILKRVLTEEKEE